MGRFRQKAGDSARRVLLSCCAISLSGCMTMGLRAAVDVTFEAPPETPGRALVYVDETYVGILGQVMQQGLRLTEGEHRISVEKTGYYPFDTVVVSRRQPIRVEVELLRLPD
jgi:hypothetical protein